MKIKKLFDAAKKVVCKVIGSDELNRTALEIRNINAFTAWEALMSKENYRDPKCLSKYGFKVHSQAEEDGFIHEIIQRIGVENKTFVEIGTSNGLESNTLYLLRQGWKGTWVDGDKKYIPEIQNMFGDFLATKSLEFSCTFVTKDNINNLLTNEKFESGLDLLSIDIDGNDYHILKAIENLNARIIVLEYNATFAPPIQWVMDYDDKHEWTVGSDCYSASLKSFDVLLSERGYSLVGCTSNGNNAFFVRDDLLGDHFVEDASAEFHYEPARFWIGSAFAVGHAYYPNSSELLK